MDWSEAPAAAIKSSSPSDIFPETTFESMAWNMVSLQEITAPGVDLSFVRYLLRIRSRNLILYPTPVIRNHQRQIRNRYAQVGNWADIASAAQGAIEETIHGNRQYYREKGIAAPQADGQDEDSLTRVSTLVTFNDSATMGVFQSMMWENRARTDRFGRMTRLCLCALSRQAYQQRFKQFDDRGTFLASEVYDLDERCVSWLRFSPCGRYVYGLGQDPAGNEPAFQFDIWRGFVVRRFPIPNTFETNLPPCMPGYDQQELLQVVGTWEEVPVEIKLDFDARDSLAFRPLGLGPRGLGRYKLPSVFAHGEGEALRHIFVAHGYCCVRENGVIGGDTDLGAVVLSRREEHVGEWRRLSDLTPVDVEEPDEEGNPSAKTELKQSCKELNEAWEKWTATRKLSTARDGKDGKYGEAKPAGNSSSCVRDAVALGMNSCLLGEDEEWVGG
ncbi:hypothetical protein B0T14DRAFT_568309 [Immersiella caudata]|uniref:Uncharacterized protein n=1 Tax=Immersiella caudata TaxID=314043 RepID=A0AA39WJT4_9PEZI|nr:hypothetical protein B0T14DRAFT_568309 [Immersiella caudata]